MKKQTAMVLSFSALLTMAAIAPHVIWQADKTNRAPSSVEQKDFFSNQTNKLLIEKTVAPKKDKMDKLLDDLAADTKKKEEEAAKSEKAKSDFRQSEIAERNKTEEVPLKKLEEVKIASLEVKKVDVDAQVSCLKEKQPADLEAQIKKLMEDKEAVVKELAELKKSKKDEPKDEVVKEKKEKKASIADNTEDVLGIMSQLTSLMISQQQQQMLMMTQMFSMFQMQQPKQQSQQYNAFSPLSEYMSPYAFNASSFEFPKNESPYSLSGFNSRIGLNSDYGRSFSSFERAPASQQYESGIMFERGAFDETGSFQPQALQPRPHNGFDFRQNTSAMDMQRVEF
ncbi:MAG: hypothetical protein H7177_03765 [Rhizobacter sp.]|nr:hypothetical protein [Bacteriovorax sp.]